MTKVKVTLPMAAGWLVSASMVIAAVIPALPEGTPDWVRVTLALGAVIITATLQSWRKLGYAGDEITGQVFESKADYDAAVEKKEAGQ